MVKRMIIMLIAVGILFGGIFIYHAISAYMIKSYMQKQGAPAVAVSTIKAQQSPWQPQINASGSLRAVKGVDVTTEIAGLVRSIQFKPGANVKKDDLLVVLNDDAEIAQLRVLIASAEIAKTTFERDKAQFEVHAVSQQTLDNDAASLKGAKAQVDQQQAIVDKKIIRAPFNGRLGISNVNPGQYLNPGDKIVTLQSLNPIYLDFYIPQQNLKQLRIGQPVVMTTDSYPGQKFTGKISTINPIIDTATRNIQVEALINNPQKILLPGMFASVEIATGKPEKHLTLPQTAISYNPYGEIAYIVKEGKAQQTFVTTGDKRGDQVTVLKGLKEGDEVVTSGQLKLKNGSAVTINNSIQPSNNPDPKVVDQ
ncbi:MAG: efflux RND transporter periplasmic adaptor subunit [Proteobacteria bacterium]|nr:efflux RND transporter periplasmic adaptor subunit [Pseudomonadota bacterium]